MNWRNRPPQKCDYDTQEEYEDAVDYYYDALESDSDEERINRT